MANKIFDTVSIGGVYVCLANVTIRYIIKPASVIFFCCLAYQRKQLGDRDGWKRQVNLLYLSASFDRGLLLILSSLNIKSRPLGLSFCENIPEEARTNYIIGL
jgi:hypothetical protein